MSTTSATCQHCGHAEDAHEWRGEYAICAGDDYECECDGSDGPLDGPPADRAWPRPVDETTRTLADALADLDAVELWGD